MKGRPCVEEGGLARLGVVGGLWRGTTSVERTTSRGCISARGNVSGMGMVRGEVVMSVTWIMWVGDASVRATVSCTGIVTIEETVFVTSENA